jgi:tRNA dimethylallyltransferase
MILIILGPTAIGKTSLAIHLAKVFNGELISADSRQVYKGMDIITGKDKSFPDHGIDLAYPNEPFSVNHWLKHIQQVIKKISRHKKLPIIVGGTGFYLNALLKPPQTLGIKPNPQLRQKLEKLSLEKLQQKLQQLAPNRWQKMNHSDRRNSRRLIRAIEVVKSNSTHTIYKILNTKYLIIGLRDKLSIIDANIEKRVYQRLKAGALKEVRKLLKKYHDLPVTLGYSQLKQSEPEATAVNNWITAERQYVRRQFTYFKKIKNIHWFKPSQKKQIVDLVKNWYYQLNND